jgi:uncharacterized protein (DUF1778 family)
MRGRPKKPAGETRKRLFQIRVTEEERAVVEQAAVAKGLDASAWARSTLMEQAKAVLRRMKLEEVPKPLPERT